MRRTSSTRPTAQTVRVLGGGRGGGAVTPLGDIAVTPGGCGGDTAVPAGEIALLEGLTVVYKSSIDLYFYVIGSSHENEVGGGHTGWGHPGVLGWGGGDGVGDTGVAHWGYLGCQGRVGTAGW